MMEVRANIVVVCDMLSNEQIQFLWASCRHSTCRSPPMLFDAMWDCDAAG